MSTGEPLKKQMRIAMVGVSPANQVMLKGYLRVLLRLDADLLWMSAKDPNPDLFVINHEFKSASSVLALLSVNPNVPVLYLNRDEHAGGLFDNQLTIPLKELHALHAWLLANVTILKDTAVFSAAQASTKSVTTKPETVAPVTTKSAHAPTQHAVKTTSKPTQTPPSQHTPSITAQPNPNLSLNLSPAPTDNAELSPAQPISEKPAKPSGASLAVPDLQGLVSMMHALQQRSDTLFELLDDRGSLAIIDAKQQRLWQLTDTPKLNSHWRLRPYVKALPEGLDVYDAQDWLWRRAWQNPEVLLPLVDNVTGHQLRFWIKPERLDRRALLQIMTAMERAPVSTTMIAERTQIPLLVVRKAVAALLLSGSLTPNSYKQLKAPQAAVPRQKDSHTKNSVSTADAATPQCQVSAAQTQKLSFLGKLRHKLGL